MPLDTAWYNALQDDDGSNTVGTPWNKAQVASFIAAINAKIGGDAWTTPTYAAGNFTGTGSLVWTVDAGDVTTFAYTIAGKMMTVAWKLDATTLSGTTNFKVIILIPAGKVATKTMVTPIWMNQSGTPETGYAQVDAGAQSISLIRTAQGNFTLGTNTAYFWGQITFEIN